VTYSVHLHSERPDLADRAAELGDEIWPEYNLHGDVTNRQWRRMRLDFPEYQFVLYDDASDAIVAEGHTLPVPWDGTVAGLPDGFDGIFELGFGDGPKTALAAMAAEIRPAFQGRGLAVRILELMRDVARSHGLGALIAAVRPSLKERYPLVPIDEYMLWTRGDGQPFDPWLRVHARIGGRMLRAEPRSLRISGTVAEWEDWTQMAFPVSGDYVFPQGLALLSIDRDADLGLYHEPNVWVGHTVAPFTDT
jgi:GNAT superfamily N-acetyltransferase